MVMVMKGVSDVCWLHKRKWICCPCSWCSFGRTWFSPLWAWGLERSWFQASFPLFSLDGLEMTYHHSKWVLSELCFSCRLCHLDLGSCMSNHNPRFQLQFLSAMMGDPSLVCWVRTILVHLLWALVDPLLCVLCQTVLSVYSEFWWVSDESDVCWSILRVLKGLLLVLGVHEVFQLEKEDLLR